MNVASIIKKLKLYNKKLQIVSIEVLVEQFKIKKLLLILKREYKQLFRMMIR